MANAKGNLIGRLKQDNALNRSRLKTQINRIPQKPADQRRIVGAGAVPNVDKIKASANLREGMGDWIDAVNDAVGCPVWNMDVIEQVRWNLQGPISDEAVNQSFGQAIDLFGSGKQVDGIDYVETTMAQTGQTQTYMVTCYIGFHLEPEPLCWTAQGNAISHLTAPTVQPPSPDVFTQNDLNNGCLGPNYVPGEGASIYIPAVLEWGWWANYAAWMLARAYNLQWKIGQHTNIMDEELRNTAYMPPSAQNGTGSSSQVDIVNFVNRLNSRYGELGTGLDFLKINRLRIGSVGTSAETNTGIFKPDRSLELADTTYGGLGLQTMLRGNSEFRKLALPYVIKPGVPIGLILQQNDNVQGDIMRQYLSITQRFGVTPPLITDEENILAEGDGTNGTPVALERTLDGGNVAQSVLAERALFKGGEMKISMKVKGFEVPECWYDMLKANPDLMNVVKASCSAGGCGLAFATQGA